jgi:hypothetical protein
MTPMLQIAIENRFDNPAESLDIESQRRMWIGLSAVHRRLRERLHRVHHIHRNRELGLETLTHRAGTGFELIDVARYGTRVRKEAPPFIGEARIASGAIEETYAKLRFQIRERLAHHRLRAAQLAARSREAALVHRGDEGSQLVQRDSVDHTHRHCRYIASKYIGLSDTRPPRILVPSTFCGRCK